MINIAIVGYGNIGRCVKTAIPTNPDTKLAAVFSRRPEQVKKEVSEVPVLDTNKPVVPSGVKIDVAILCGGSKEDVPVQGPIFAEKFNTIDSFDTHADIPAYFAKMNSIAKARKHVSIVSAGWDPGVFSLERVYGSSFLPRSSIYTFWGPGVSQGHSDAARKVTGVLDARQYTIPIDSALEQVRAGKNPELTRRQMHRRVVYVVADPKADKEKIRRDIVDMPKYYDEYDTEVNFISAEEMRKNHSNYPHGGFVFTSGVTGKSSKQILEYRCQEDNNPEFTGSILVACARAAYRMQQSGMSGAFTMLDVPPAWYSPYSADDLLHKFV